MKRDEKRSLPGNRVGSDDILLQKHRMKKISQNPL